MSYTVYYIKVEDEHGNLKNYLRFTDRTRASQAYEYILDTAKNKVRVILMDQDFNPIVPFHEGSDGSFNLYQ